jgi:hypothetical protein
MIHFRYKPDLKYFAFCCGPVAESTELVSQCHQRQRHPSHLDEQLFFSKLPRYPTFQLVVLSGRAFDHKSTVGGRRDNNRTVPCKPGAAGYRDYHDSVTLNHQFGLGHGPVPGRDRGPTPGSGPAAARRSLIESSTQRRDSAADSGPGRPTRAPRPPDGAGGQSEHRDRVTGAGDLKLRQ